MAGHATDIAARPVDVLTTVRALMRVYEANPSAFHRVFADFARATVAAGQVTERDLAQLAVPDAVVLDTRAAALHGDRDDDGDHDGNDDHDGHDDDGDHDGHEDHDGHDDDGDSSADTGTDDGDSDDDYRPGPVREAPSREALEDAFAAQCQVRVDAHFAAHPDALDAGVDLLVGLGDMPMARTNEFVQRVTDGDDADAQRVGAELAAAAAAADMSTVRRMYVLARVVCRFGARAGRDRPNVAEAARRLNVTKATSWLHRCAMVHGILFADDRERVRRVALNMPLTSHDLSTVTRCEAWLAAIRRALERIDAPPPGGIAAPADPDAIEPVGGDDEDGEDEPVSKRARTN